MIDLANAAAVITGASSGIGAATALALAGEGARLALLARNIDALEKVAHEARLEGAVDVMSLSCDVREEDQVDRAISGVLEHFGKVDILVNCAGLSLNGRVEGYPLKDWRTVMDTNLTGTFLTCRAVVSSMKERNGGQIVNISSGAGRNGISEMSAYCASKFGVLGFTESLALEVRDHNIRVAALLPGSVATNFTRTARRETGAEKPDGARHAGYSLLPEEVASVILSMLRQSQQAWMSEVVLRPLNLSTTRTC